MSAIRNTILDSLYRHGLNGYAGYAEPIISALEDNPRRNVRDLVAASLREQGVGSYLSEAGPVIADITTYLGGASVGDTHTAGTVTERFDRAGAAHIIREFIGGDYDPREVDALMVLAGLEDEDDLITEERVMDDPRLLSELVAFAREAGFRGR